MTLQEIAKLSGMTPESIRLDQSRGIIEKPSGGSVVGASSDYTEQEAALIIAIGVLSRIGFRKSVAANLVYK